MIDPKTFLEFLKDRRTIRSYQQKSIPDEEIEMILEAGRWAPSASNRQEWKFIVIKDSKKIENLAKTAIYGKFVRDAPLLIAITADKSENPNWFIQDTSLASMNMQLMAWSLDIGTCWIGSMDRKKAKDILNLDDNDFLLTILPFGYYKKKPQAPPKKELEDIVETF
jgi:nitroreductase